MTDEERETAVAELIDEWQSHWRRHGRDECPLQEHLGLTEEQYGTFIRHGALPPGYVPPNRDGHADPSTVEAVRDRIVWMMVAAILAGVMLWFVAQLGAPK